MKKILCLAACAAAAVAMSGCQMCNDHQDSSCVELSHATNKMVSPGGLAFATPTILESQDAFIPQFEAGAVVEGYDGEFQGVGNSVEEATNDAIVKFKIANKCDYVVIVSMDIDQKIHPTYRLFKTSNYAVTITRGVPLRLAGMKRVAKPAAPAPVAVPAPVAEAPRQDAGTIRLSDIQVQISAKGVSEDGAAVIYPVK